MAAISWTDLLLGLGISLVLVVFPRLAGWVALRRDSIILPVDPSNPRDQLDYSTVMRVLGAMGLVAFGVLCIAKLFL